MGVSAGPDLIEDGLVLYLDAANKKSYPGTGTIWYDLSGYRNNGNFSANSPTFNTANGGSLYFNGSDNFVTVPWSSRFPYGNQPRTLCCFFKGGSLFNRNIFAIGGNSYDGGRTAMEYCYAALGNELGCEIRNARKGTGDLGPPGTIINRWIYYCVTLPVGGTVSNHMKLYVNAIYPPGQSGDTSLLINTQQAECVIGKVPQYPSGYFQGNISIAQLYNRELSQAEITQNFNALRGRFNI